MKQIIQPDLTVSGRIGYCLEYAARVFHNPAPGTNAWNAWLSTAKKHYDAIPTDVSVLCWFSYITTINGVYANYGHVVIPVPGQGFYSSPWKQGTDHAVLPSIAEVERIYGVKYVGWSEDILGLNVVEGDDGMNKDQAQKLSLYLRLLDFESVDQANSHSDDDVSHMLADPGYAAALAEAIYKGGNWQDANNKKVAYEKGNVQNATILKPGNYTVN